MAKTLRCGRLAFLFMLLAGAGLLAAKAPAGFAGRWKGAMNGPQGSMTMHLKLWQKSGQWKGSISVGGNDIAVHQLKVKGIHISFVTHFGQGNIKHTGTLHGNTLNLRISSQMFHSHVVLHRQTDAAAGQSGA